MSIKKRLAVLASGSGTNFQAIADACQSNELPATVELLITNKKCPALQRAAELGVEGKVISYASNYDWDKKMLETVKSKQINFIVLAGYLKKIGPKVLNAFEGKMVNIHPALLPKFGGPGMYGINVHKAVYEAGEKTTGSTVHWVTANYDEGPIISQVKVELSNKETPESIAQKVKAKENKFYVETLKKIFNKDLS